MTHVIAHFKVADYARWRGVFDAHAPERQRFGEVAAQVFRGASDGNEVVTIATFSNLEQAHAFRDSAALRDTMIKAGVISQPELTFLQPA